MTTVTLEEAKARLDELIANLPPGESITITRDQKPVAQLSATQEPAKPLRQLGFMKGTVLAIAPDFDAPVG